MRIGYKGGSLDHPEEWLKAHSKSLVVADAASLFTGRSLFSFALP